MPSINDIIESIEAKESAKPKKLAKSKKSAKPKKSETPIASMDAAYEPQITHKLNEIPILLMDDRYVLLAAFLCHPGLSVKDLPHYTTGVKVNDKWIIYDDMKKKSEEVSSNRTVLIHALLYLKR